MLMVGGTAVGTEILRVFEAVLLCHPKHRGRPWHCFCRRKEKSWKREDNYSYVHKGQNRNEIGLSRENDFHSKKKRS